METDYTKLEVVEFQGNDIDYVIFVKDLKKAEKAELRVINDKFKWVLTREDGSQYILIPKQSEKVS